ncbi:MAG TPA: tetratricopeptide repeat protein, partial [Pirellulales bacterium]|nr:tetratricopeptide repeat protein [Pirellulales bacterium]
DHSWKTPLDATISSDAFAVGENELIATVTCHRGPPALWLALDTGAEQIVSDGDWQASLLDAAPQPARLAEAIPQFRQGSAPADGERPLESLAIRWPTLLVCGIIALPAAGVLQWLGRRSRTAHGETARTIWLVGCALAVAWLVLLASNCRLVPFVLGYDSELHLDYVEHIQRHGTLPRGDEGLEMWQPPLYYMIASLLTSFARAPAKSEIAVLLLRGFSYLASLAQLALVAGCLRRLYPGRSWSPSVGLFFAGCVPMQLYLMHYASNDVLAALLSTASLYAALVVVQQCRTKTRTAALLGVCLGAATITKLTTWPVVLAIFVMLLWQLLAERRAAREWFMRLAVPALTCALVCGWYFARNYQNFGQPLPPDQAGYAYGQDPGYSAPKQFLRFGRSLGEPFFSAFASVPDGLYSTLWGDGAWGGQIAREGRPPWNYDLMAAGYLVAILPSLLILVGIGAVLWQVLRGWQPEKLLLLVASAASFCGISYFYLRHPMYGAVKAHYAFASIASLSLFLAEGCVVLTGNSRWRRLVLTGALGTWGLASLGAFFIVGSSPETQRWVARQLALQGNVEQALGRIRQAIHTQPRDVGLHLLAGRLLHRAGRNKEASAELNLAMQVDHDNAELQLATAQVLNSLGQQQSERTLLQSVVRLAPDDPRGYLGLAHNLANAGQFQSAVDAARAGLRASPVDPRLHVLLAEASVRIGRTEKAIEHYRIVLDFNPADLPALSGLASIFAMHPDPRYRNSEQAVELARRASELTERHNPSIEDVLGAAYAEAGNFAAAERTLRAAIEHVGQEGPDETLDRLNEHLATVESREPLREPALGGVSAKGIGD